MEVHIPEYLDKEFTMPGENVTRIVNFDIENPKGDGIRIRGSAGPTVIAFGRITGAGGHGISIGPAEVEAGNRNDDIVALVKALSPAEMAELKSLLQQAGTEEQKADALSNTAIGRKLLSQGVNIVDCFDKITRIIERLGLAGS